MASYLFNVVLDKYSTSKPYVVNAPNLYFNLSHTRNAIIVSISDCGDIGVDIERVTDVPECSPEILSQILHIKEKQLFNLGLVLKIKVAQSDVIK